jgi:lipoprotein LpqH
VVKREIWVGVTSVAIAAAACAGCSSNKSDTGQPSSPPAGPPAPKVVVDGQTLNVSGPVTCTTAGSNINIGIGDVANGVGAVVSTGNPPIVHSVGLGNVNGITMGFSDAAPNQATNAGAAVDGKAYGIKGTASGVDMSNPTDPKPVYKTFEMSVTCP